MFCLANLRKRNLHILGDRSLATVRDGNEMAESGAAFVPIMLVWCEFLAMTWHCYGPCSTILRNGRLFAFAYA